MTVNSYSFTDMKIPNYNTSFKAWMDYRTITDTTSPQWEIQSYATTDDVGFRKINDYYIVAMGTYYSNNCGEIFKITLDEVDNDSKNKSFTVLVGEIKRPDQTDEDNMYHPVLDEQGNLVGANVLEFIVDTEVFNEDILSLGDISSAGFEGQIIKIERIDML